VRDNPEIVERKLVTVLFADLVGSTALADEQDPERTRAVLDRFYAEMAAEVEAVDGTVEKFAGDAVMAAFGAPTAHEDHAERALHAALAMQRRLREAVDPRLSLAALGDRKQLEAETKSRRMSAYLEPFGMRALGIVREDEKLLAEAAARFEGIELDWHAAETRRLVPGET